jgi:hypothetical protein
LRRRAEIALRLALSAAAVLALSQRCGTAILSTILPLVRSELELLDGNLLVHSLALDAWHGRASVLLLANLRYPWYHGASTILPLGWPPNPAGWYVAAVSESGALQAVAVFAILVIAWPARGVRDAVARGLIALPLALLLFVLDAPLDLLGNFQHRVLTSVDATGVAPLYSWARFLEGGGNLALAITLAGITILGAEWPARRVRPRSASRAGPAIADRRSTAPDS